MDDTSVSTKEKSRAVTSPTKASRQTSNQPPNTPDSAKPLTEEKAEMSEKVAREAEKLRDLLSRLLDINNSWSKTLDVTMPEAFISTNFVFFAFPTGGHVIKETVTPEGKQNFMVDDVTVIPVTSEEIVVQS